MARPRGLGLTQGSTLLVAALMDAPAIYHWLVVKDMPADTAMLRFLICVPVAAVLLMIWHLVIDPYRRKGAPLRATAQRLDTDDQEEPPYTRRTTDQ